MARGEKKKILDEKKTRLTSQKFPINKSEERVEMFEKSLINLSFRKEIVLTSENGVYWFFIMR